MSGEAAAAVAGPLFVTARSTLETTVMTLAESLSGFGSPVAVTVAVFVNDVPEPVAAGMLPVRVNVAVDPGANEAGWQLMVPPEPGAGVVHGGLIAGPLFCTKDTNVIVPGSVSVNVRSVAVSGPLLKKVIE